jgi:uncharacterized protein (TIRG00374 family)
VGYAVNILLPARLGELFRADYTARICHISRSRLLASIFLERSLDLLAVLLLLWSGLVIADVRDAVIERVILSGALILVAALAILGSLAIPRVGRTTSNIVGNFFGPAAERRLEGMIGSFAGQTDIIWTSRFVCVVILSIPIWLLEGLAFFCVCAALGLALAPAPLMALLGGSALSTLFPTAPGFAGSYQLAFVLILQNFGVPDMLSLAAASGIQIYLMLPFALAGLITLGASSLFALRTSSPPQRELGRTL